MKKYDVTALGELLIDFGCSAKGDRESLLYEANPGGAPANVLSMLSKLGKKTAFIGKVGGDFFGAGLKNTLSSLKINTDNLIVDASTKTTLAFVHNTADGERSFDFFRSPGADTCLRADEVDESIIRDSEIFHFGSLSMTAEPSAKATRHALDLALAHGCLISFDPNLRLSLWDKRANARNAIRHCVSKCDILKIADDELEFLTGTEDADAGIEIIKKEFDIPLIFLTLGKGGSIAYCRDMRVKADAFLREDTIDITGAGDVFCACALNFILDHISKNDLAAEKDHITGMADTDRKHAVPDFSAADLRSMLLFAGAAASLITTRRGTVLKMPERSEIMSVLHSSHFYTQTNGADPL